MRLMHSLGKLPLFSELLLVAALAWMLSSWLLPDNTPKLSGLSPNADSSVKSLPNLARLVAVPLFGKIKAQIQPAKPVITAPKLVAPSPLKIKLLGTVVAEHHGAAIIALAQSREQRVYFIGDSIQPGVILKTVEAEAIIVERGGKLERISLEQGTKLTSSALPIPKPMGAPMARSPAVVPPASPPLYASAQTTQKRMNRNQLQKQLQNFPALLSQARVIPRMVNGKANGFTITNIAPGSLYQQAGLQNGDVILSVNGKQITGAKQAMNMYQTLQSAAAIDLALIRSGQTRLIHYDIH